MKKSLTAIILSLLGFSSFADTQNSWGVANNVSFEVTGNTVLITNKVYLSDSWAMGIPYNASISDALSINDSVITTLPIRFIGYEATSGDTIDVTYIPHLEGNYTTTIYKGSGSNNLSSHRNWGLDSALFTGVGMTTSKTVTLPHSGTWRIRCLLISEAFAYGPGNLGLRDKKISNLDTANFNPNLFFAPGPPVILTNVNTVVGEIVFNNSISNTGPQYITENWNYVYNSTPVHFNLGFNDPDGDSLVITHVPTKTSYINTIPVATPDDYLYLYDSCKAVSFKSPFTLSEPFNTGNTFWFDSPNQTIHFTVPDSTQQQAVILTFKVDEYRTGSLIGTTLRDVLFVVNQAPVEPNEVKDIRIDKISVFPNPASNFFLIENYSGPVEIYNFAGQKVLERKSFSKKIDTSTWPNGLYVVKTENDLTKIVIRH